MSKHEAARRSASARSHQDRLRHAACSSRRALVPARRTRWRHRMAAGVAAGVYDIERMAAVTFTRKAAAELRGRFQLALEEQRKTADAGRRRYGFKRRCRTSSAFSPAPSTRSARTCSARGRSKQACLRASPSSTSRRTPTCGGTPGATSSSMRARPAIHCSRSCAKPASSRRICDDAFEVLCDDEDVEFPPGDGERPDVQAAWVALDQFWARLQTLLPRAIPADTTARRSRASERFKRQLRVSAARRERPAVLAQLLGMWDFEPKITQKWWSEDAGRGRRSRPIVAALHGDFRANVVEPFMSAWRAVSVSPCRHAADESATERARPNDDEGTR